MDFSFKKTATLLGKILVGLLLLVFLLIGIALNFVFTPEKITPKVVEAINQNLNAEMNAESIELSFFKTFPNFTLEVEKGSIVNHLNDTVQTEAVLRRDSLVIFDRCALTVNPWAFLRNKIVINELVFEKPQIYAYISPDGNVNWDILKSADSIKTESKKSQEKTDFEANIDIRDVQIQEGYLFYENGLTDLFSSIEGLGLRLKAQYNPEKILLDLDCRAESSNLFNEGDSLLQDFGLGITSKLEVDRSSKVLHSEKTGLIINDASFVVSGDIFLNKEKKVLDLDLVFGLENASLENLLGLLPASIIDKKALPQTKGDIELDGKVKGDYGKEIYPAIDAALKIKNGEIAYRGMANKLDKVEADLTVLIDPSNVEKSFFNLDNCEISSKNTSIKIKVHTSNLMGNTALDANLDGNIDLSELQKTIPFKEEIKLKGNFDSKLEISFTKEDIKNANYGNIQGKGFFILVDFLAENSSKNNVFSTRYSKVEFIQKDDSKILNEAGTKVRGGRIELNDLLLKRNSQLQVSAQKMFLEYGAIPKKDTLALRRVKSNFELKKARFQSGDSLKAVITSAGGDLFIGPSKRNSSMPSFQTKMQIDSAGIQSKSNYFGIKKGSYDLSTEKNEKNLWPLDGNFTFERLVLFASSFPLEIKMPENKIKLQEGEIRLEKAHLTIGRSDFTATGSLSNFGGRFFRDELMKGDLSIRSKFTDVNQMIKALNAGEKNEKAEEIDPNAKLVTISDVETADSTAVFVVPKGVEFVWNTQLDEVKMGKITLKNLKGQVVLKDQKIAMNSLNMITNGAKMFTSSTYEAKSKQQANMAMDFKLMDIDLANLIDMFPVLDSIMPMAGSFDGHVNFRMKGRAQIDANLGMAANKLELIARILGKNMVIMDSETFRKMAKMLFFKDKEKNVIDEMSFALQYNDQVLEVFPSEFQVDRYRVAVGGVQRLNGNYSFHVSVLKTPVPLVKMGIDVKGTAQGNDFDLTNAKYKYFFAKKDKRRQKADQELMARKEAVIKRLPF